AVQARLIDGGDRTEPHRHRRELPEGRHATRVRVRRQALPADLASEVVELIFGEPALEERARVDAGRRVPLEVDLISVTAVGLAAEEVVEADLVERGRRRVGREVTAEADETMIRTVD